MAVPKDNRRKRLRYALSRLRKKNRTLRDKLSRFQKIAIVSIAAVAALIAILGFVTLKPPEPVLLGMGSAGVKTAAELAADSLRIADSLQTVDSLRTADSLRMADSLQKARAAAEAAARSEATSRSSGDKSLGSGSASYYGNELSGKPTASGERFDPGGLTAAHRTLPFGSRLRVTNVRNGKSVIVRVNDRGPFSGNRVIDLSKAAASRIGMLSSGTATVQIELLRG